MKACVLALGMAVLMATAAAADRQVMTAGAQAPSSQTVIYQASPCNPRLQKCA